MQDNYNASAEITFACAMAENYQLSPLSPMDASWMWPDPLEDRHKEYSRFFSLDPEHKGQLNWWLRQNLPLYDRPIDVFVAGDGMFVVRRLDGMFSTATFVLGDLLDVFRKFVVTTALSHGLKFKDWRVDADHVQRLLDLSVAELDNIKSDQQLRAAVNWHNDVSFETAQLGFFGEFGFEL
jgi:hypothetical protein